MSKNHSRKFKLMFAFLTLKITQRLNPTSGVSGRSKTMHIKGDKALGFEISDTPWNTLISIGIAKSKYQFSSIHTIHTFLSMAFKTGISARERFLTGTNVNTPSFQVPTPEFWHGTSARVQGRDSGTELGININLL